MQRLTLVLTFLVAAAVADAQAPRPESEILAVAKRLFDGMRASDSARVRSVFHPQVRLITVAPRQGVVRTTLENGSDDFVRAVGTPHPEPWDERIFNEKIQIDGALASMWVDYVFYLGEKLSHCGIDHFLLTKETGEWKILELADTRRTEGCVRR